MFIVLQIYLTKGALIQVFALKILLVSAVLLGSKLYCRLTQLPFKIIFYGF